MEDVDKEGRRNSYRVNNEKMGSYEVEYERTSDASDGGGGRMGRERGADVDKVEIGRREKDECR